MPWTVTRQCQWPEGQLVVEISSGGIDYTNPDALVAKYPGEMEIYDDPQEAAKAAIAICEGWRRDGAPEAQVAHGATGGMTLPFEPSSYEELREWAKRERDRLPKCDRCGGILPEDPYRLVDALDDERFCSEYCAEERYRELSAEEELA